MIEKAKLDEWLKSGCGWINVFYFFSMLVVTDLIIALKIDHK